MAEAKKEDTAKDKLVKMQEKMNEAFSKDEKADPIYVERLNQIFHDAIASFPPEPLPEPEDPTEAILKRMSTELEAIANDPNTPKDMAKDVKMAASAVEHMAKDDGKIKPVEHAQPAHAAPPKK